MSNKFEVGDRVILIGEYIIPTIGWPVWGSEYGCVGTIVATEYKKPTYTVEWDNGKFLSISYLWLELSFEDNGNPNTAFLKHKRTLNEER